MNDPLITVIVPVYGVEKYLNKCVDSILNQTYTNIEVILIDDESPDRCPEICDEYAANDKRVKVIHQKNAGQSAARNAGLDIAKGEYISFVDSDDYVDPSFLEKMYRRICDDNSDLVACEYDVVDESENVIRNKAYLQHDNVINEEKFWELESTTHYMFCAALWNKLFKASTWNRLRLKVGKYAEDSFAMTRYIAGMKKISVIKEPLYYYFLRDNSLVHSFSLKNLDAVEARLERCKYFYRKDYRDYIKGDLYYCINLMNAAYGALDLKDAQVAERYNSLRKECKRFYWLSFGLVEFNMRWVRCSMYCLSDATYYYLIKSASTIKKKIKKVRSKK
ncbi:MAG: glycosyltransferase family 2 protein [Ruminococcus sp.]|nr:glycosyltransferase family 2 protein [Ruminococcus sp.]